MMKDINYSQNTFNNLQSTNRKNFATLKNAEQKNNITHRPAQAISFGGSINSVANKFVNNKNISKVIDIAYENEAAYKAVYSLFVAGMLKPLFVLNMPGSEDKDKQIVATKNFLGAFIGCFMGLTIDGGFVKKAVDVVKNNLKLISIDETNGKINTVAPNSKEAIEVAESVLKKEHSSKTYRIKQAFKKSKQENGLNRVSTFIKSYLTKEHYIPEADEILEKSKLLVKDFQNNHKKIYEKNFDFANLLKSGNRNPKSNTMYIKAFETLWKNSTSALTAIGKAKIASVLLPSVTAFLFAKKNLENQKKLDMQQSTLSNNAQFKTQQEEYKKILNNNSSQVQFKGNVINKGIETLAKGIETIGMSKPGEKCAKALSRSSKTSARMGDIESFAITAYWLQNTSRSKKIEPSQKLGLNVHTALVTIVSSTASFIIDRALDGLMGKAETSYKDKINSIVNEVKAQDSVIIRNPEEHIKDLLTIEKRILKDECKKLLSNSSSYENGQITDSAIKNTIEIIQNSKTMKESSTAIDENLIKNYIKSLKDTEPVEKMLKEKSKNLVSSSMIAKELSQIDLNDAKAVAKKIDSLAGVYKDKLSKFKSLTVFTLVVRFLVPVLMVPFSGKLKKKIIEATNGKNKEQNNNSEQVKK